MAVTVCCAAFTVSACWNFNAQVKSGPAPAAGVDAEALILSVEDVRRIANSEELATHEHSDLHHPSPGNVNAPGTCRAVGNSEASYAGGWTQYREVGYSGVTDDIEPGGRPMIDEVSQAVVVYPDAGAASGALHALGRTADRLCRSARQCLHFHAGQTGFLHRAAQFPGLEPPVSGEVVDVGVGRRAGY